MENLTVIEHPLLRRDLTVLRRAETPHGAFREKVSDAAAILAYEAMRGVEVKETRIQTQLEEAPGYEVADRVVSCPYCAPGWA